MNKTAWHVVKDTEENGSHSKALRVTIFQEILRYSNLMQ